MRQQNNMIESKQAVTCNFLSIARTMLSVSQMFFFCILLQGYTIVLGTKIAGKKNRTVCCVSFAYYIHVVYKPDSPVYYITLQSMFREFDEHKNVVRRG